MADLSPRVIPIDEATLRRVQASLDGTPPAPRGVVGRALTAVGDRLRGWMGPGRPIAIMVPVEAQNPRAYDYRPGFNLSTVPRVEATISAADLQALSTDTLTRLAIETCKNRLERCNWEIRPRDESQKPDPKNTRMNQIRDRLQRPDGRKKWQPWLRSILDDRYVLDAASAYIRRGRGGLPIALEQIYGATVRPLFDETGRAPLDVPAFRQIIHGIPTFDFPQNDFVYAMRNPRAHTPYGFSEVEQLVLTINVAVRRELRQLSYFTEGTISDAMFSVDKDFGGEQAILRFQDRWDSWYGGGQNQNQRHKLKFIPPGTLHEVMGKPLQDEFDEWIARKISYGFNLPALWAVKMQNRATAETAEDASMSEGMQPDMLWVKSFIDDLIEKGWGDAEFGFFWHEVKQPDPEVQSRIFTSYVGAGIMGRDEARVKLNLPPIGVGVMVDTPMGPVEIGTLDPATGKPKADPAAEGDALPTDGGIVPTAGPVQDTALNGAQIAALVDIAQKVSDGSLTPDGAIAVIIVSFPTIDEAEAKRIVDGAKPIERPDPSTLPPGTPPGTPSSPGDPNAPPDPNADAAGDAPKPKPGAKLQRTRTVAGVGKKERKALAGAQRNSKAAQKEVKALSVILLTALLATRDAIALQVAPQLTVQAMQSGGTLERRQLGKGASADLDMGPIEAARAAIAARLAAAVGQGADQGANTVEVMVPTVEAFSVDSAVVSAWAKQRAAELVGKRVLDDGTVIDNPNPRFAITESTRAMVQGTIVQAFDEGWSRETLIENLSTSYAFSETRATLIARTEVSRAVIAGNVIGWQASGVVEGKEWLLGSEHAGEDECDANAAAGTIGINEAFPSGDSEAPAHPGCVCDISPVLQEDSNTSAEADDAEA